MWKWWSPCLPPARPGCPRAASAPGPGQSREVGPMPPGHLRGSARGLRGKQAWWGSAEVRGHFVMTEAGQCRSPGPAPRLLVSQVPGVQVSGPNHPPAPQSLRESCSHPQLPAPHPRAHSGLGLPLDLGPSELSRALRGQLSVACGSPVVAAWAVVYAKGPSCARGGSGRGASPAQVRALAVCRGSGAGAGSGAGRPGWRGLQEQGCFPGSGVPPAAQDEGIWMQPAVLSGRAGGRALEPG